MTLIGSDGRHYTFLAKPKDDLRKDNRMMEAAGVVNRLFAGDPAARRRNLYLRCASGLPALLLWYCCGAAGLAGLWAAATRAGGTNTNASPFRR